MISTYPTARLGDLLRLEYGKPLPAADRTKEKIIPAFGANGILCWSRKAFVDEPSIIVGRKGSAGEVNMTDGPFWPTDVTYFVQHDKQKTDLRYLFYLLKFLDLPKLAKGVKPGINRNDVYALRVPIPTLAEQRRIVATLDDTFEGIAKAAANTTHNLASTDELFDSELQTLIDHAEEQGQSKPLADICDITSNLVDPKLKEFQNLLHIGAGNMVTKSDALIDLKTAKEEKLISGKFLFDESMVLYSKIRPYLMKVSRPDFSGLCSADVYPLLPRRDVMDRDYLFFILLSKKFTDYAISGSGRAGMPKVNRNHLFAYSLKVPSISVQKEIVQKLNQTMDARGKLKDIYLKKQDALVELKSSLLHQAFSGKLTGKEAEAA